MAKNRNLLKNKKGVSTLFIAIYLILIALVLISTIFLGLTISNASTSAYLRTQESKNQEKIIAGPNSLTINQTNNAVISLLVNNTGAITVRIKSIYIHDIFICDPSRLPNDSYIQPQSALTIQLSSYHIYYNDTTMFGNWTVTTERGTKFSTAGYNLVPPEMGFSTDSLYYGPLLIMFNQFEYSNDSGNNWYDGWKISESSSNVIWRIKVADIDTRPVVLSSSSNFALIQNSQQPNKIATWDIDPAQGLTLNPGDPPRWISFSLNGPNSLKYMNTPIPISSNFLTFLGNLVNPDNSLQGFAQTIPFEAVLVTGTPEVPTTTTLNAITSALTAGQSVSVSGQVTANPAVPSGNIIVIQYSPVGTQDWLNIINPQITNSATGSYSGTFAPPHAGNYQFRAVFMGATKGQTVWASSNSMAQNIVVKKASSTTTVAPITTTFGQSITATATVTPSFATGTITFQISSDNGATYTQLGNSKTLISSSATSDSYTPPTAGTNYRIMAIYSGDSDVSPSTSSPATLTVNKLQSVTSLTLPSSPLSAGSSFTITASVTPIAATGTVTFEVSTDNGNTYSIFSAVTLSSGSATSSQYTLSPLYSSYKFIAVYSGDNNVLTSTSSSSSMSDLKFAVSGLDSSAQGTIVSVTVGSNPTVNAAFGDFTKDFGYVSSTSVVTYAFTSTVPSSSSGERFVLTTPAAFPASGFLVSGATTVTGTYKTQFQVSFTQTGITSDAGGNTVLTLGTSNYAYNALPSNVWIDKGTTFSWSTPVAGITGERFVYVSDSGLASPIVASGTDAAIYKTQYLITFVANGAGSTSPSGTNIWEDAGSLAISATANAGYHFIGWSSSTGSTTFGDSTSASTTATISGPDTITANFDSNPVTHFSVVAPASATAGTPFTVTVTALDASDNIITGYSGTIHFTSTDSQSSLPSDYTFQASDLGVATFSVTLITAGTQTITATDTGTPSITGSASVVVGPAFATALVVSTPSSATAGSSFSISVTAKDPYGNTATGYTGTIHFTSSDAQAVLPADSTLTSGTGTFTVTLETDGVSQTIIATDTVTPSITGTSDGITVGGTVNSATQFVVSASPLTVTAGGSVSVTVTAKDAYGNVVAGYAGTVDISSSDPQAVSNPASSTLTNGVGSFIVTLATAGTQSITAGDGVITGSQTGITVNAAGLYSIVISPASTTITAGNSQAFTAEGFDQYSNDLGSYTSSVTWSINSGSGTFIWTGNSVQVTKAGSWTVTATLGSAFGTASLTVNPGALNSFTISVPSSTTAGSSFGSVVVSAYDAYGNLKTDYVGSVYFQSSDPSAVLPYTSSSEYTFTTGIGSDNGQHTFNGFTLTTVGSGSQTITVVDGAISQQSAGITMNPAGASSFVVSAPASATAGTPFTVTVTALDPYGNVATGYTGTVHFTTSDSGIGVILPVDYTFVAGDNGAHTFTDSFTLVTAGSQTVTATDTITTSVSGTASLTVS